MQPKLGLLQVLLKFTMKNYSQTLTVFISILLIFPISKSFGQTVLKADGSDTTYKLINSVLAPGYNVVETPDCIHKTEEHIDQVFDSTLMEYVFRFKIHKFPDNDRCKNLDRQRTEIKTYDKSPDELLAHLDETVTYKWRFKIDDNFQPSSKFTHLHQIKGVDGPFESMPLITLTTRKGNPNKLELRYAKELSQSTILDVPLSPLQGQWIDAVEVIHFQKTGKATYALNLNRVSDSVSVMSYTSTSLQMWKDDASFLRPKWGIYRSLIDSTNLRDENVLFADISINESNNASIDHRGVNIMKYESPFPNPCNSFIEFPTELQTTFDKIEITNLVGKTELPIQNIVTILNVERLQPGIHFVKLTSTTSGDVVCFRIIKD
jgi:hypothetical protein